MTDVEYRFLAPLDVLFLRGNRLFGDPGSFGEALVPPWPSVVAGAMRSRVLVDDSVDLAAFAAGDLDHPSLGTPKRPGSFTVVAFHLARRLPDGRVEILRQLPADLIVAEGDDGVHVARLLKPTPQEPLGLSCSASLPLLPVLAEDARGKPASGYWLTETGWGSYLKGETPDPKTGFVKSGQLWGIDPRVGVGLDADTRRAADGRLFSVQAVAPRQRQHPPEHGFDVGFLVAVSGAVPPSQGMLRLGGDGRAAAIQQAAVQVPEPDYDAVVARCRCRLVLTTPGIFAAGWLPTGATVTDSGGLRFALHGVQGRLVCAAVPRAEVVSGWDLAQSLPKAAQLAAPTGCVYWLDDVDATPEALRKLAEQGLWDEPCEDPARRAEGFNRVALAAWR